MDEARRTEQRAPAAIAVPGQRDVEALADHAVDEGAEPGPGIEPETQQGDLWWLVTKLEETEGAVKRVRRATERRLSVITPQSPRDELVVGAFGNMIPGAYQRLELRI